MSVPVCGQHPSGVVVRDGWYGQPPRRRQRWRCRPGDGTFHRFTEVLPRIEAPRHDCVECENHLDAWQGPQAPRLYTVPARPVTRALLAVAAGRSYSAASYQARVATGIGPTERMVDRGRGGRTSTKQHGQLVADWVEVYAPLLWEHHAPTRWPDTIVIDSKRFQHRSKSLPSASRDFHVLVAVGYDTPKPAIVHIEAVPKLGSVPWQRFLRALDGEPRRIVADGATEIASALKGLEKRWPPFEVHRCEYHLAQNVRELFTHELRDDDTHSIHDLLGEAFTSMAGWAAFCDELAAMPAETGAQGFVASNRTMIEAQIPKRPSEGPYSNAAAETALRLIGDRIRPRRHLYKNRARTTRMLELMACDLNGWNDELTWNELIRARLADQQGRPATDQRTVTDHGGVMSLRK